MALAQTCFQYFIFFNNSILILLFKIGFEVLFKN